MKHSDYITHIDNSEDHECLKTKHFQVNTRLFGTSEEYRDIILQECAYIRRLCSTEKDGYKKPHGMSSANAGLAHNIIAYLKNRNLDNEKCIVMINPRIVSSSKEMIVAESNCGSLTLKKSIRVKRHSWIRVLWFTENGKWLIKKFTRNSGGLTIQHEIDHNNGILITDRECT